MNAVRSAWQEERAALDNAADILGMERIDILQRKNRVQDAGCGNALGQRQLHQDAMHARVAVKPIDERQEFVGRRFGRQPMQAAGEPVLLAGLLLVADIDLARRIFADQDRGQAGPHAGGEGELADVGCDFGTDLLRERFAVQKGRSHAWSNLVVVQQGLIGGRLRDCACHFGGLDNVNPATAAIEFHNAINQGEKRIVAALTDALPRVEDRAHLPDENIAGTDQFAAKPLYTATLGIGIPAIAAGSLTFLMCHINT